MSETSAAKTAPKPDVPKKQGRWKRRILWTLGILLAIAVALRVILIFALPPVLRSVAGRYGLDCTYERIELYLLSSDVGIWHLSLTPKEGGPAIAHAEYCRADVSPLRLLRGELLVHRVEADEFDFNVNREANGKIPLLERFISGPSNPSPAGTATSTPQELSLASPIRIDALRINRVKTHFRDQSVNPPVDTQFELTVRVSDVGSSARPARFLVDMTSPPLLDSLRIEGQGTSQPKSLDATMRVIVRGLHPKPAAGYLASFGIKPLADEISADMSGQIRAQVVSANKPGGQGAVRANLILDGIAARADLKEALALDRLTVMADAIDSRRASIIKIALDGIRASATRNADGALSVAGLAFVGQTSPRQPDVQASAKYAAAPFAFSIAQIDLTKLKATLDDQAVSPHTQLVLDMPKMTIKNIVNDPAKPDAQMSLEGQLAAPGIAKTIQLSGSATPFAAQKSLDLSLRADGIRPDALGPYLDALGLESQLKHGAFAAKLRASGSVPQDGPIKADLQLDQITFSDGQELLAMNGVKVGGVTINLRENLIRVENVELAGPNIDAKREASGALALLGLRTKAAKPAPTTQAIPVGVAVADNAAATKPIALPKLQIGKLTWKDIKLKLEDKTFTPPSNFALSDVGVELSDITIDLSPDAPGVPGKLHAWMRSPELAKRIDVTGTITPAQGKLSLSLDVSGQGIDAAALAPYLKSAGVEPVLRDGAFKLHTDATIAQKDNEVLASISIDQFGLTDSGVELIGVDGLRVENLVMRGEELEIGAIEVTKPRAKVTREKDGNMVAAGARIVQRPQVQRPSRAESIVIFKKLVLKEGAIHVRDEAVEPPAEISASANATLDNYVIGKEAPPAQVLVSAKVDGALDDLTIKGTLSSAPMHPSAVLDVTATKIRQGPLTPYLPPGTRITLTDGRFHTKIEANASPNSAGGTSPRLIVSDLDYRDGQAPLLRLDSAKVIASRIDLPKVMAFDEISVTGLETEIRKTTDGNISALGVTVSSAQAETKPQAAAPATQPAAPLTAPATAPSDVKQLVAKARQAMPLITVEKLDLNVRRAAIIDSSRLDSTPLTISDLHLRNVGRIEALGDDAASRPPVEIELVTAVAPVIDSLKLNAKALLFSNQPYLNADLTVSGIKGDGLTEMFPELRNQVDASQLKDGRFIAQLETEDLKIAKRGPYQYDFHAPIDLGFVIKPVEFRASPDGPVLAGVEEIRASSIHADPKSGAVRIKALDITKPSAQIVRAKDGVHVLGLIVKVPEPGAATQPAETATQPTNAPEIAATPGTSQKPSAEQRIDKLTISGLDFRFEDRTTDPPTVIPLSGLDVEVRDLSNLALYEDRPIRFSALVNAGKVSFEQRGKESATIERDFFSQATASGRISLYPKPRGWVKASMSGLELAALKGAAQTAGVDLNAGIFDANIDARFTGDGSINTRSRFVFSDLRVKEPPDGPIHKFLRLPAPLDAVIVALEDSSGGITLPLDVPLKEGQVNKTAVAGATVGALGSVIATALASSPMKAAQSVAGLIGFGGGKEQPLEPVVLEFSPAETELDGEVAQRLGAVADQLRKNKRLDVAIRHEIGGGDVARAAVLANPTPEDCLSLASQIRQQKLELLKARSDLAGQARGELALRSDQQAQATLEQLRGLDRQIAAAEDALDQLYDMLKPGADRQADRRTRAAAVAIGQARLDSVRAALLATNLPSAADRIHVARAQFTTVEGSEGGKVVLTLTRKK